MAPVSMALSGPSGTISSARSSRPWPSSRVSTREPASCTSSSMSGCSSWNRVSRSGSSPSHNDGVAPKPHPPAAQAGDLVDRPLGALDVHEDALRMGEQRLARAGQLDLPAVADEER